MFKLIAGLYSPSYGEVLINGENIVPERKIPANLGALIEEPGFIIIIVALRIYNIWQAYEE